MSELLTVYIGYDQREHEAYEVCRASLERRSSIPLKIVRLDQAFLRHAGIFSRASFMRKGQRIDLLDGKPFSTDFSFTRFLVPPINLYQGWALFCDCDFLFTADIAGLLAYADDRYAVMCVKHDHDPIEKMKMDGMMQTKYRRKNWSSLVLWNCAHASNRVLTLESVNRMHGQWLHAFEWLQDGLIGELPVTWNWLSGVSDPLPENAVPNAIHFTLGGPWFENCQDVPFADLWRQERDSRRLPGQGPLISERAKALHQERPLQ